MVDELERPRLRAGIREILAAWMVYLAIILILCLASTPQLRGAVSSDTAANLEYSAQGDQRSFDPRYRAE